MPDTGASVPVTSLWPDPPAASPAAPGRAPEAAAPDRRHRRRLGEVLVDQGLVDEATLSQLLVAQSSEQGPLLRLGQRVIAAGLATERQIAEALADALGLPLLDLARTVIEPEVARLLPRAVAERLQVLAVRLDGGTLQVAMADPTNVVALDDVRLHTGIADVRVAVTTSSQLADHLARTWSLAEDVGDVVTLLDALDADAAAEAPDARAAVDTAPVVRLVDVLITDAVLQRASDVHIEPQAREVRIRFRVDGLLRDVMTVPRGAHPALVSRVKILSGLDIAERRRPQDGRARLSVGGTAVDARVSTLPSLHGEKVVIRLLARAADVLPVAGTGLTAEQAATLGQALTAPQGLVLLTGPTGSGKTSTLYSLLQQVRTPERNIVTLEDPVEIAVPGIVQVQVHERSGMTFARGLRSVLRQDPDIVLVGEIRDSETAELALQASLTGHLVLSTLHTNDAVAALTRLVDMGVEPFLIASSLSLVAAQRLVRRPCVECATAYQPSPRTLQLLGVDDERLAAATPRRGRGCPACGGTGYRGRLGVFEVLPVTAALRAVLLGKPDEQAVSAAARSAGMRSLRETAVDAALRGETTFDEVLRATPADDRDGAAHCGQCSRPVRPGMVCCPWCGADLGAAGCAGCGRAVDVGWRTCPWCRTAVTRPDAFRPAVADPGEHRGWAAPDRPEHPGADPAARPAAGTSRTDTTGTDTTGADPTGTDTTGAYPTGAEPAGTEPAGAEPAGTDPTGTGAADDGDPDRPHGATSGDDVITGAGRPRDPETAGDDAALPRARVLAVDDDPSVTALVAAALIDVADVTRVGSAEEALREVAGTGFDAIVLDLSLPDLTGQELVRLLRADRSTATVPLVLFTGASDVSRQAEETGADGWLVKPSGPQDLVDAVTAALRRAVGPVGAAP